MNIRIVTELDVVAISLLYGEFYQYNMLRQPSYCAAVKESGNYPRAVIEESHGDIFVAEDSGKIIGFIHIEADYTPPLPSVVAHKLACIEDFYVRPEYRKRGAGKALLERAKEWASGRGLEYLELTVLEENAIGRSFYEREKFVTASRTMRYTL